MTFGARLAAARRAAKLTQQELGRGLGTNGANVSKSVVYGWEKDQHHPRVDQLVLICKRLGCSADYLLEIDAALSPKVQAAKRVVSELSDEERQALLSAIQPDRKEESLNVLPPHVISKPPIARKAAKREDA